MFLVMETKAQTDGFFRYHLELRDNIYDEHEMILLPDEHGVDYNYSAENASVGHGLLLLSSLGVLYMIKRKR